MRVLGIIVDLLVRAYARNGKEIYPQEKNDSLGNEAVANAFDIYTNDTTKDIMVSPSPWKLDDVSIRGIPVWRARATVIGLTLNIVDASNATEPPYMSCSAGDSVSTAEAYALYDANRVFVKGAGSYAIYDDYSWHDADTMHISDQHITTAENDIDYILKVTGLGAVRVALA